MLKVIDIMTAKAVSVSLSTPVIEAAHKMKVSGTKLLTVCSRGKFQGVVTAEDIVTYLVANGTDPVTASTVTVMNSNYPLVSPDDSIAQAARIMADNRIQALPVVQDSKLLGLVTLYDVIAQGMIFDA